MLRLILRINALSCLTFGALFLFYSTTVLAFLGTKSLGYLIPILGAILIIFGIHLIVGSLRKRLIKGEVFYFSLGDFLWVLLSAGLILFSLVVTTTQGYIAAVSVAAMVGAFGIIQYFLGKELPLDQVVVRKPLKTSEEVLWNQLSDFGNIQDFHPMVKISSLIGPLEKSLGAKRLCTFNDGTQVQEEVIDWIEGKGFEVQISGMKMPLDYLSNKISINDNYLTITATFRAKSLLTEILIGFMMRPLLRKRLTEVLSGFNSQE